MASGMVMAYPFKSQRHLVYFSYIGTNYSGVPRQVPHIQNPNMLRTIQGAIEDAFEYAYSKLLFKPRGLYISSRTDSGVHAVCNVGHFDLEYNDEASLQNLDSITLDLNSFFKEEQHSIRINKIMLVPQTFHSRRNAKMRTYTYRIGLLKNINTSSGLFSKNLFVPLIEKGRCAIAGPEFDRKKFRRCLELFLGTHVFTTFMSVNKEDYQPSPTRTIDEIDVYDVGGLGNATFDPVYENLDFIHVQIKSRSFLYKQIRRMVGAAIGVAEGRVSESDVQWMLENPGKNNWHGKLKLALPDGLYLTNVHYDEKDLVIQKNCESYHFHQSL